MNILPKIYTLKDEAEAQLYEWFEKEVRPLPKRSDGTIDNLGEGLVDNDVDAMRHAFVSGDYVQEFSEETSEFMGRLNEFRNFNYSSSGIGGENMDLWDNAIGRSIAKKCKSRRALYETLLKATTTGELILDPSDPRKYKGKKSIKRLPKTCVIKIKENKNGANIEFLDVRKKRLLTKAEFINAIKLGEYPGYAVRNIFWRIPLFNTR